MAPARSAVHSAPTGIPAASKLHIKVQEVFIMRIKRTLFCILALALLTLPVSAHGHGGHGGHARAQQSVVVCPVEDCEIAGRHVHNGVTYCGYEHAAGFCDGACKALCPVKNCQTPGLHSHHGAAYCGDRHLAGFCEGNCHMV